MNPNTPPIQSSNFIRYLFLVILVLALWGSGGTTSAAPAEDRLFPFDQPDGTQIFLRVRGDEWFHWYETSEGRPVTLDEASGYWVYRFPNDEAPPGATLARVGLDQPPGKPWRPQPTPAVKNNLVIQQQEAARPSALKAGTGWIPVLLGNFSNTVPTFSATAFSNVLFYTGPAAQSMSSYFSQNSYGRFTVSAGPSGVRNWLTVPRGTSYYAPSTNQNLGTSTARFVRDVVLAAIAAGYNFAPYDQDGDGKVDVVNIIHAGRGQESGGGPYTIWSHRSKLSDQGLARITNGSVIIDDYVIQPELGSDNGISTIGVFVHEHGHALGLPDLYDTDYSSFGVGKWSGMSFGENNGLLRNGDCPALYDAWCKAKLGWVTPINYTLNYQNVQFPAAETNSFVARLWKDGLVGQEYFLVENRCKMGFDLGLPTNGLLIWHIDESKINLSNTKEWYLNVPYIGSNTNNGNYLVSLVQADNYWQLETKINQGDDGDPFPGSTTNRLFSPASAPNSYAYNAGPIPPYNSYVVVSNISDAGSVMTADIYTRSPNSGPVANWVNIGGVKPPYSGASFAKLDAQHPVTVQAAPGINGTPLSVISLFITRGLDGRWWNFTSQQWETNVTAKDEYVPAALQNGLTLSFASGLPFGTNLVNGSHTFITRVIDTASIVTELQMPMTVTHLPEVTLSLADNAIVNTLTNFTAVATEGSIGIQRVDIALYYDTAASEGGEPTRWYWDGYGWTTTPLWLGADFPTHPNQATLYYPIGPDASSLLEDQLYTIAARAVDTFGDTVTNEISVFYDPGPPPTIYWRYSSSGSWFNPYNWSDFRVPNASDHVVVNQPGDYVVTVDGNANAASLRFGRVVGLDQQRLSIPVSGSLSLGSAETNKIYATASLDQTGNLAAGRMRVLGGAVWNWTSGAAGGSFLLHPGAFLSISGPATKTLSAGAVLDNYGFISWSGPGLIYNYAYYNYDRAIINNRPNAWFNLAADGQIFAHDYNESVFNNFPGALLLKSGGANSNAFNNFTLFNSGEIQVASGEIRFDGHVTLDSGTTLTGNGSVRLLGSAAITGPVSGPANLRLEGGSLAASGTAAYSGSGGMDWTAGTISGTLEVAPGSLLRLSGAANKTLDGGARLNNRGDITWAGPGVINNYAYYDYDRATINNQSNATFSVLTDGTVFAQDYQSSLFNNQAGAVFRKTGGAGATLVNRFTFNNAGLIGAESGALEFNENLNLGSGGRLTGAGEFSITAGQTTVSNVTMIDATAVTMSGGNLNGEPSGNATLATTNGGSFNWAGGTLSGTLNVAPNAAFNISGAAQKTLASGSTILNNAGNVTWSGAGNIYNYAYYLYDRATINNLPGGVFNVTGNAAFTFDYNPSFFNNASNATFAKMSGGGLTACNWIFNNDGLAGVANGVLALNSGGNSSGSFSAGSGALLRFTGGTHSLSNGVSFGGAGRVQIDGATLLLNGDLTLGTLAVPLNWDLTNGTLGGTGTWLGHHTGVWTSGAMAGNQTMSSGGTLIITNTGNKILAGGAVLNNQGTMTWFGPGPIYNFAYYASDTASIHNQSNGVFNVASDGQVFSHDFNPSTLYNEPGARFVKTAGTNATAVNNFVFDSTGEIRAETGSLLFDYVLALGASTTLSGAGAIRLAGNATLAGPLVSTASVRLEAGSLTGTSGATYSGGGVFDWTGGTLGGAITLAAGSVLNASGAALKDFGAGAVFTNQGTVNWLGSGAFHNYAYYLDDRATFNNAPGGMLNITTDGPVFAHDYNPSLFNNAAGAKVRKTAGIGTSSISFAVANSGTIEILMGTLDCTSGLSTNAGSAEMNFTIGGPTPGAQFGRLNANGSLPLGGKLKATFAGGFSATNGQFFNVLNFGSRTGQFATYDLPPLLPGLVWRLDYSTLGFTLSVRGEPQCVNLTNGLVAWWPGEGGLNRLATGSLTPFNGATNTAGQNGQAFALNGSSYWSIADAAAFRPASLTVEGWVLFNSYGGLRTLFGKPIGNAYFDSFTVWLDGTTLRGTVTGASGFAPILGYPFTPELGRWYHLAFTFDDATKAETLYLDGTNVASATGGESIAFDDRPLVIGADIENGSYTYYHDGLIDEVGLYNRALSAGEIASLFNAEAGGRCPIPEGTNPLQIVSPAWTNGHFHITLSSPSPAARAIIYASTNLQTWLPIYTNDPFTGAFEFIDSAATNSPMRFYRAGVEP